jgi:MFS family permease
MEMKETATVEGGYGWVMVGVAFLLTALSFGILGSVGVFLKPLAEEFGWSRGGISFGYTAVTLATGAAGVLWGILADRIGARIPAMIAAIAMGAALLMMSQIDAVWEFYALHFAFGAFGHGALMGPMYANVGLWFSRNAGLAIGIATAGGAVGQGVVPAIARWLIDSYGWDWAYATLGVGYMVIAFPLALTVRQAPNDKARATSAMPTIANGSPFPLTPGTTVAWISGGAIFCCACMAVPLVHLVPMLSDRGMAPQAAVTVLLVLMLAGGVGRLSGGKLADWIGALPAYMVMSFGQTILVLGFPYVSSVFGTYVLAIVFGLFYSGVMSTFLVCVRMMVPPRMMAGAMSTALAFAWLGMGIGGWQGGLLFDLTGNYTWSYTAAGLAGAINLAVLSAFLLHLRRARTGLSYATQPAE